ncbi:hypothetical protein [Paenibacillus larvae]|uniref:hypothetical protein n=1 Tax=Paenibacillus larvae TaxID=1464 RepID=UPI0022802070|nr:hypothetical protein [Paenibacillus larvae]MCY9746372.1 hypothetical protein [Paenibacillus larvae]MCY9752086.1 hypothetical protein [Paenibacillus larvae]
MNTFEVMKAKLGQDTQPVCENDEEYYFMLGQITRYIHASFKHNELAADSWVQKMDFARQSQAQKRIIDDFVSIHSEKIDLNNDNLRRILAMLFGYVPDKPKDQNNRVAYTYGLTADSLLMN